MLNIKTTYYYLSFLLLLISCATTSAKEKKIKIKKGETLYKLAQCYKVPVKKLALLNSVEDPNKIREGQTISLPSEAKKTPKCPSKTSHRPQKLIWPVKGKVSSHYGLRGKRPHHGIDIRAPRGTPVNAVQRGKVIYSGRMRGYGKIVIIDHGHYKTYYAHLRKILAFKGYKVKKGQVIGQVGRTGNARGYHLHFEYRNAKNQPKNPIPYLRHRVM